MSSMIINASFGDHENKFRKIAYKWWHQQTVAYNEEVKTIWKYKTKQTDQRE